VLRWNLAHNPSLIDDGLLVRRSLRSGAPANRSTNTTDTAATRDASYSLCSPGKGRGIYSDCLARQGPRGPLLSARMRCCATASGTRDGGASNGNA